MSLGQGSEGGQEVGDGSSSAGEQGSGPEESEALEG